jgi:hypothetical protein
MLTKWRKRRAMKRYLQAMPQALAQRYGGSGFYTRGQVEATLGALNLPTQHVAYAFVLFMSPSDAAQAIGHDATYINVKNELAREYFDGDLEFNASPLNKRRVGNSGFSSMGPTIESQHD